jgi:large subunit ribosomal protein L4
MIKVPVYNKEGDKVEEIELSDDVFGLEANHALLHQAYVILSGNTRRPTAHTKDRSERSGSGRKPWKQKGTGRARAGSLRSPLWRKGGITFGPTNEKNYIRELNAKMRKKAVSLALSEKVRANTIVVVNTYDFDTLKTARFAQMIKKLDIKGSILAGFVSEEKDVRRTSRNIQNIQDVLVSDVSVKELLDNKYVLMSKASVAVLEKRLGM